MLYKYCVHIYVNVKMIPVETIPGMGEGGERNFDKFDILLEHL
jgi:hypothetical protein